MVNAKQMRTAAQKKALRPRMAKTSPAKTKVHGNLHSRKDSYSAASSMIFLNPKTKVGKEYYVEFLPREGWVFNRGHARSTYHFYKTRAAAMEEMKDYAERHDIKYKPEKLT
jgi:hypothetical protein